MSEGGGVGRQGGDRRSHRFRHRRRRGGRGGEDRRSAGPASGPSAPTPTHAAPPPAAAAPVVAPDDEPSSPSPAPSAVEDDAVGPVHFIEPPEPPRDVDGEDVFVGYDDAPATAGPLVNLTPVKFGDTGSLHAADAGDTAYRRGDRVVVESDRGPMLASVAVASYRTRSSEPLRRILRRASDEDERTRQRAAEREREAFAFCRERIRERKLPMKLVRAEVGLQGSKTMFYFSSEERVDFRELVRDLAHRLRGRIEMRQIGARDEAKAVGGIGDCGRELCCSTFLPAFVPVSIKMAKDQGLVLNPSRVTGLCGRLKCCLVYEESLYAEMRKTLPKVGKRVKTPAGEGRVTEVDVLRQLVRVGFPEGGTQTFPATAIEQLALSPAGPSGGGPSD